MGKIGTPDRVTELGELVIRSITPEEECKRQNKAYEWTITLYSYSTLRKTMQELFELSDPEFFEWLEIMAKKKSEYRHKKIKIQNHNSKWKGVV